MGYPGTGIIPANYAIERCMAVLSGLYFLYTRRHAGTLVHDIGERQASAISAIAGITLFSWAPGH